MIARMKASSSSPKLFENPVLDYFTRCPFWVVPLIWLPISFYLYSHGLNMRILSSWQLVLTAVVGFFSWTLSEYWLHRIVFHYNPGKGIGARIHFYIHGIHHDLPDDAYRLVMPPLASFLIAVPIVGFFYFLLGSVWFYPFFSGYLVGYVAYEMSHYSVHHLKSKHPVFLALKRHHLQHHFSKHCVNKRYGVSSTLWDHVFKTY